MSECVFCRIAAGDIQHWKVLETENCLAFLDARPMVAYHTLVIPKAHYPDIFSTPDEILAETIMTVKRVCELYEEKLGIHDVQLFNNSGPLTMQTVFHLHFHIFPKTKSDQKMLKFEFHPELVEQYDEMLTKLK